MRQYAKFELLEKQTSCRTLFVRTKFAAPPKFDAFEKKNARLNVFLWVCNIAYVFLCFPRVCVCVRVGVWESGRAFVCECFCVRSMSFVRNDFFAFTPKYASEFPDWVSAGSAKLPTIVT